MILKELDPFHATEPFELAGRRAEEQMAFYLRREFGHYDNVYVINGLRAEREGDACQIDHLLVHPYGFAIIESKSVTTEVAIDEKGDWSRLVDGKWKGMPSPINQAQLQFLLLQLVIDDYAPTVLGKLLGLMQKRFYCLNWDAFAAVSDNGIINWPAKDKYDSICKADGVCEKIKRALVRYKSKTGVIGFAKDCLRPLSGSTVQISYPPEVMKQLAEHLISLHKPLERKQSAAPVQQVLTSSVLALPGNTPPNPTPESTSACQGCSARLSPRVMDYCRMFPNRFSGHLYCMQCQRKY